MSTVYVFLADGFEEIEALTPIDVLRRAGVNVRVISVTSNEVVNGAHQVPVVCDKILADCDFSDAGMLLLPGGMPGAATLASCEKLQELLLMFSKDEKPIAAICAAPMALGKLGILQGKKATCYPGFEKYLQGATCTGKLVEIDGNIITAKGPGAAMDFAMAIVDMLCGAAMVKDLKAGMIVS